MRLEWRLKSNWRWIIERFCSSLIKLDSIDKSSGRGIHIWRRGILGYVGSLVNVGCSFVLCFTFQRMKLPLRINKYKILTNSPSFFPSLGIEKIHQCCTLFRGGNGRVDWWTGKKRGLARNWMERFGMRCCPGEEQGSLESVRPFEKGGVFPSGGGGIKAARDQSGIGGAIRTMPRYNAFPPSLSSR